MKPTEQLGVHPIINGVGYATRVSGSCPHPEVIAAMSAASAQYFEIDDLLKAANSLIASCTGSDAGLVTCGAGAALTLAAAACLAGNRPDIMDQLPDVSGCPRDEIIFPIPGPFDYDHALRLAGAKLKLIDYQAANALQQIENAITSRTAALGFVWLRVNEKPDIHAFVELAHRYRIPVIVDAACALPPTENLRAFSQAGADLIAYSGGKHLGGPQASGILCGRLELIRSAWVQMVDMDVREGTWSLEHWISEGWLSRPPRHGIGRSMKVSKEAIIGVMTALKRYATRDHAAEYSGWQTLIDKIYKGICDVPELEITRLDAGMNGQRYPNLKFESGSGPNGLSVRKLLLSLRNRHCRIILAEDEQTPDRAFLFSQCLRPGDDQEVITAIQEAVMSHRERIER